MKILFLTLLIFSQSTLASFHLVSGRTTKLPVIKKRVFFSLIQMMEDEFQYLAKKEGEKLIIYGGWQDSRADMAFARRWDDAEVLIYRGMAHRVEVDADALILIICHELGHLYGGAPYKDIDNRRSPEGQADYFATHQCLKKALEKWSPKDIAARLNKAVLNIGLFLANNRGIEAPTQQTPDLGEVVQTNMKHPSPQCRLDTYYAGLRNEPRPACWYKELFSWN